MFVRINQHFSIQLVLKEMKNKLLGNLINSRMILPKLLLEIT